jgi:hypothetical protein
MTQTQTKDPEKTASTPVGQASRRGVAHFVDAFLRLIRVRSIRRPDVVFPPEVLALQRRGVPLPTWYSGPMNPTDGLEVATRQYEGFVEDQETAGDEDRIPPE